MLILLICCSIVLLLHFCGFAAKIGEPGGSRTLDNRLKRAMLYQLSYRLVQVEHIVPLALYTLQSL